MPSMARILPTQPAASCFSRPFFFSRRFCVLYHIHRRLLHQQVQFHFMKHRRFFGVRGFVDRNCPSLYSPETLEVCRLQSSSCHAGRYGISRSRVLPPQCVVAVAVRGSVFFRCKQALASISRDDCEPLCRRVGSGWDPRHEPERDRGGAGHSASCCRVSTGADCRTGPIYVASLFIVLSGIIFWLFFKRNY